MRQLVSHRRELGKSSMTNYSFLASRHRSLVYLNSGRTQGDCSHFSCLKIGDGFPEFGVFAGSGSSQIALVCRLKKNPPP